MIGAGLPRHQTKLLALFVALRHRFAIGFARDGSRPALKEKHNQKIAFFF